MGEMLEAALHYAELGMAVFPLSPGTKEPLTRHGFEDASTDPEVIRDYWRYTPTANIGIATGKVSGGLLVVDLDNKNGVNGLASLKKWAQQNDLFIPPSWTTYTASGGNHILFHTSKQTQNRASVLPGVDIRGDGGYIVAPPSKLRNGGTYTWMNCDGSIEEANEAIEKLMAYHKQYVPDEQHFEMPDIVPQGQRNDTLYRLACSLQSKGVSDGAILAAVMAENNAKCNPPVPEKEVQQIIRSATSKAKGNAYTSTYEAPKEVHKEKRPLVPISASELQAKEFAPIFYPVKNMIPEGETVVAAPPKTGKSWMMLDMCIKISKGEEFLGFETVKSDTLYLALEDGDSFEQERLNKVLDGEDAPNNFHFIFTDVAPLSEGFIGQLEDLIAQLPNVKVIVIDTLKFIKYNVGKNETAYEADYRTGQELKQFAEKHHLAIVVVTHTTKLKHAEDEMSDVSGTNGVTGAADSVIVINKEKRRDTEASLFITGRKVRQSAHKISFDDKTCKWSYMGVQTDKAKSDAEQEARREEYLNSDIRMAVIKIMEAMPLWKGRCGGLIEDSIKVKSPIVEDAKTVGAFLGRNMGLFAAEDGINVKVVRNGTGGRFYEINVDTVDESTVNLENPFIYAG